MRSTTLSASAELRRQAATSSDHRVYFHGVSWEEYEAMLAIRGDQAGVRMAYLRGELELMSPSQDHEGIKKLFARLLEGMMTRSSAYAGLRAS